MVKDRVYQKSHGYMAFLFASKRSEMIENSEKLDVIDIAIVGEETFIILSQFYIILK